MESVEEKATEYQKIEDFVTDEFRQRTDRLISTFPPNDYVNRNPYAKDSFRVGYTFGATEQDPISRAEQKKIDIEKTWNFITKHFGATVLDIRGITGYGCEGVTEEQFKQAMEE